MGERRYSGGADTPLRCFRNVSDVPYCRSFQSYDWGEGGNWSIDFGRIHPPPAGPKTKIFLPEVAIPKKFEFKNRNKNLCVREPLLLAKFGTKTL